ncbi:MAG: ShlB/FhaC/HecB family hemolysin secretion/activation protein [Phascolarctobacterium sp.]|uniref:ShlB/FhaC/HecB family hemolysin secretion/activation protein n=1 Tax=Phascolarctobacterium sp. TaxID=2049039 RepID=UPI0026DB3602|nr:ShlB/FhaC/HecB family hemolysin secretion/activation protein [Phascolarctobacterium sp.]MDO4921380.1 ShlB/FhaC/HecB family hemolysin secretion/activation protein [Phascolarctobacterium sp.]
MMKKFTTMATALLCTAISTAALAASPIPSFDKEAVTTHPYNRTGQQQAEVKNEQPAYRTGNTGTEERPAFYVQEIILTGFELPDELGELQNILAGYSRRSVGMDELQNLTSAVTDYARRRGYTVAQAVVPPQQIEDGKLEVKVYVASFDTVKITRNDSAVVDKVLQGFAEPLRSGEVITDKKLERVLNNLNDLPGVTARGVLRPGSKPVTTALEIEAIERRVWNNYLFVDNGGSRSSGRYRYGFHTEINNPGRNGDKIGVTGYISNKHTKNYGVNYELPIGSRGTRWGVGYSRSSYDLGTVDFWNPTGESEGFSFYGLTTVYRDMSKRATAIYGYDHRKITDDLKLDFAGLGLRLSTEKTADVLHVGIAASEYLPNRFTSGNIIYWYGDIDTKDGDAYYDGAYHKLTADFNHVRYWKLWNLRFEAHAQLANRGLDGSERFYLGGLSGVRAYPASETSGDTGYTATMELRRATDIEGLEVAAFVDVGEVKRFKDYGDHRKLAGWGLGLRYAKPNDWYAQFDYAWKIDGEDYTSEDHNHDGRMWFQIYKMF